MKCRKAGLSLASLIVLSATECALPRLTNDDPGDGGQNDNLGGIAGGNSDDTDPKNVEPECDDGDTHCLDEITPEVCDPDGKWRSLDRCTGETPVCNQLTHECAACDPDDPKRCENEVTLQRCSDEGEWIVDAICQGPAPFCVEEEESCGACLLDAVGCRDNVPRACSSDGSRWIMGDPCEGQTPACLSETGRCGTCIFGAHQCDGNDSLTCLESGEWGPAAPCEGAKPVCAEGTGECEECDPESGTGRSCQGNTPRTCVDYEWVADESDCAATSPDLPICHEATGACVCSEGTFRCASGSGREQCSSGSWQTAPSCSGSTSYCLPDDGSCVQCLADNDCSPENDCFTASCSVGTTHTCTDTPKIPAGTHRCDYVATDDGYCDGAGACVECSENSHCPSGTASSSETLCRSYLCVDPARYLGWSYPGSTPIVTNTQANPSAIYWFQLPPLPYDGMLSKFGAHGSGSSVSLKMALYADGGTEPGSVLAETGASLALFNGHAEIAAVGTTALTAGERYWVAVKVSTTTTALRRTQRTGARGWLDDATYADNTWPMFNLGTASDLNNEDWGIYIEVLDTE